MDVFKTLVENNVQDIIKQICEDFDLSIEEAMFKFYNSITYEKLKNKQTGLYVESSDYLFEMFKDELSFNSFIQKEI